MTLWTAISWALLPLAIGVAAWAVFVDPARGRLRCPGGWKRLLWVIPWRRGCWYDMAGVARGEAGGVVLPCRCPECGREWRSERDLKRRRTRGWAAWPVLVLLLGSHLSAVAPRIQRHGWAGAAPYWALATFAPIDNLAMWAVGNAGGFMQASQAERILGGEWLGRPASWESWILATRLRWAVDHLNESSTTSAGVVVWARPLESEGWWGSPIRFDGGDRNDRKNQALFAAALLAPSADVTRPGTKFIMGIPGVACYGGSSALVREAGHVLQALVRHGRRPGVIRLYEATPSWPRRTIEIHEFGDIASPDLRLWTGPGLSPRNGGARGAMGPGRAVSDPTLFELEQALRTCLEPEAFGSGDPYAESLAAMVALPGVMLLRHTEENQRYLARVIDAMASVWRSDFGASEPITSPEGLVLRVYNVAPLASNAGDPQNRAWEPDPAITAVGRAVRDAVRAPASESRPRVGSYAHIIVLLGSEAHHAVAAEALESLRRNSRAASEHAIPEENAPP